MGDVAVGDLVDMINNLEERVTVLKAERDEARDALKVSASSFCRAHAAAVQQTNDLRLLYDAAVRDATEAHSILMGQLKGRDPERRQLMCVLERLQRIVRGKQ